MTLTIGTVLQNRYRILSLIGQGGFGAVYRAADMVLKHPCAVKENLDTSPEAVRQFEKEAVTLAGLAHANLPRVTNHFVIPGQGQYLVMDFVEGEDLETMVRRGGPVAPDIALDWIAQIADVMIYMHEQNPPVIHRDIKPANIRITPRGKAMLVDFGLVKTYAPQLRTTLGARAVTPGYAPPEQYGQGTTNTDARTDIYALAATFYTLLTGLEPQESVQRIVEDQVIPAHQRNTQIEAYLGNAIEQAMRLSPSQRYQTAEEFKQALYYDGAEDGKSPWQILGERSSQVLRLWANRFGTHSPKPATSKYLASYWAKARAVFSSKPKLVIPKWVILPGILILALIGLTRINLGTLTTAQISSLYFVFDQDGKTEIYRLREGEAEKMTLTPGSGESWSPFVSASGALYFVSDRSGRTEIYRLRDELEQITFTPGDDESWSPFVSMSGALYFVSDRSGRAEIYRLRDELEQITFTPGDGESWSPFVSMSGALYFVSDRSGRAEIYRLRDELEQITFTPGDGESWSPFVSMSGALYFVSDRSGRDQIYRIANAQTEQITHTWASWSPFVYP